VTRRRWQRPGTALLLVVLLLAGLVVAAELTRPVAAAGPDEGAAAARTERVPVARSATACPDPVVDEGTATELSLAAPGDDAATGDDDAGAGDLGGLGSAVLTPTRPGSEELSRVVAPGAEATQVEDPDTDDDVDGPGPVAARRAMPGDGDEEVEEAVGVVGRPVDEHEAARARPRERALGDPGDERSGDAGIDCVATLRQDLRARLRGERMPGRDCAFHAERVLLTLDRFTGRAGSLAARGCLRPRSAAPAHVGSVS